MKQCACACGFLSTAATRSTPTARYCGVATEGGRIWRKSLLKPEQSGGNPGRVSRRYRKTCWDDTCVGSTPSPADWQWDDHEVTKKMSPSKQLDDVQARHPVWLPAVVRRSRIRPCACKGGHGGGATARLPTGRCWNVLGWTGAAIATQRRNMDDNRFHTGSRPQSAGMAKSEARNIGAMRDAADMLSAWAA